MNVDLKNPEDWVLIGMTFGLFTGWLVGGVIGWVCYFFRSAGLR